MRQLCNSDGVPNREGRAVMRALQLFVSQLLLAHSGANLADFELLATLSVRNALGRARGAPPAGSDVIEQAALVVDQYLAAHPRYLL